MQAALARGDHVAREIVDEHALGGHDAGRIHEVLVDRRLGLEQQDLAGNDQVPEMGEEAMSFDQELERASGMLDNR